MVNALDSNYLSYMLIQFFDNVFCTALFSRLVTHMAGSVSPVYIYFLDSSSFLP